MTRVSATRRPATTWWWVRHGPTHHKGLIGWTDLPADLSDTGTLARLDAALPKTALVVSSDLTRAVTTADAIQAKRQRLPHARTLREINFGDWEGRTFQDIAKSDPARARAYWSNPGKTCPPNGESWNDTAARVAGFVAEVNHAHPGADIIAVAHFGVILTQLQHAAGIKPRAALSFSIDNLSLTRLQFLDPEWRVLGVNHLFSEEKPA